MDEKEPTFMSEAEADADDTVDNREIQDDPSPRLEELRQKSVENQARDASMD